MGTGLWDYVPFSAVEGMSVDVADGRAAIDLGKGVDASDSNECVGVGVGVKVKVTKVTLRSEHVW